MTLTEMRYHADRCDRDIDYQDLDVKVEANNNRKYITFKLMESRWRSKEEAADYLRWAAGELERLPV